MPAWLITVWTWIVTKLGKSPAPSTQTEHEPTAPVTVNVTVEDKPLSDSTDVPVVKTEEPTASVVTVTEPTPETNPVEADKN